MANQKQKLSPSFGNPQFPEYTTDEDAPIREEVVEKAVKFLSHPSVRGTCLMERRVFLIKKGLTFDEINEAFRRFPDPEPDLPTNLNNQDGGQVMPYVPPAMSYFPPQPFARAYPPLDTIQFPTCPLWFRYTALAVASSAGTFVLFKKSLIPRLESWVRRVMFEEETDPLTQADAKPSIAETVAAIKAASVAATDLVRATMEMMKARSEEMQHFRDLMYMLDVQVHEMRSLSNSFRNLEDLPADSCRPPHPKSYNMDVVF